MFAQLFTAEFVEELKSLGIEALDLATAITTRPIIATNSGPCRFFIFIAGQGQNIDITEVHSLAAKLGLEVPAHGKIQLPSKAGSIKSTRTISTSSSVVQLESFPRFSDLPRELRTEIYHEVLPIRWITAAETHREVRSEDPAKASEWVVNYDVTGAERPAIAKACKEAGEIFISTGVYKPLFNVHGTKIGVYFNERKDIVQLRSDTNRPWGWGVPAPQLLFNEALTHNFDVDKIKRLSLNLVDFERYYAWSLDNIGTMAGLEELHITGKIPEMNRILPDFLHVDFQYIAQPEVLQPESEQPESEQSESEQSEPQHQAMRFTPCVQKADGAVLAGVLAMREAFEHIADQPHQQRLMELWRALDRGRLLTVTFPSRVSVFLEMVPVFEMQYDGY